MKTALAGATKIRRLGRSAIFSRRVPVSLGLVLVAAWVTVAFVVPAVVPIDPLATAPGNRLRPPSSAYLLGTDSFGRPILDRLIGGAGISLTIGAVTTALSALVGVTMGLIGGYVNYLGPLLMRINDGIMAFPGTLFAIVLVAVFGQNSAILVVALTIIFVPTFARITYGQVTALRTSSFVRNAASVGASTVRIIVRHILPNITSTLIVQATYVCSSAILIEASLSFIGVGVAPPAPSWGVMIGEGQVYIRSAWWVLVSPCLAIASLIFALCLLGDEISERLDNPTSKFPGTIG
jgi:peptide/nickel transport system permease protein